MKKELDELLCKKYQKLFRDRRANMQVTAMCWGFDHGDGWFNIIDQLCGNIQHHVDWKRKQRASSLKFNRALKRGISGDMKGLYHYHSYDDDEKWTAWSVKASNEDVQRAEFRAVPNGMTQPIVVQVKEKFGTLRFYMNGGDEHIEGMIRMAESMSGCTCEECGNPGKVYGGGWVRTLCEVHAKEEHREDEDVLDE